jgi:hypothetical protein
LSYRFDAYQRLIDFDGAKRSMLASLKEAQIAIEAALATAGIVAQEAPTKTDGFVQLVAYLHEAAEALAGAEDKPELPPHTIFPTQESANDFLAGLKPVPDVAYRLSKSGDGKCVIQVFTFAGLL